MRSTGAFDIACRCAASVVSDKIISSDGDLVAACLYGTFQTRNSSDFKNVTVVSELDGPDAKTILELEKLPGTPDEPSDSPPTLGALADALWLCSSMFSGAAATSKVGSRRVFLFTNDFGPHSAPGEQGERERCIQRARDLSDLGIRIVLFPIMTSRAPPAAAAAAAASASVSSTQTDSLSTATDRPEPGLRCPGNSLYCEMLVANGELSATDGIEAAARFDELRDTVRCKEFRKRTIARLPLVIGEGDDACTLGVKMYVLQRKTEKGRFVMLDAKTNTPLKSTTQWVSEFTGSLLMPSKLRLVYPYGGERTVFDRDEISLIKCCESKSGIHILGFKPLERLKPYHTIQHSSFLYPDEHSVKGSITAFTALLEQMLEMRQFAVARYTHRAKGPSRLVALLPQQEVYSNDGNNVMLTPAGFHLIPLPFADDLRDIDLSTTTPGASHAGSAFDATSQQAKNDTVLARRVVKKLRINFTSRDFDNPSLQRHYASLQALALDREDVEPVQDHVMPDREGMARFEDVVKAFVEAVYPPGYECSTGTTAALKRTRAASGGVAPKRARIAAESADQVDWIDAVKNNSVSTATVALLKQFLTDHGVKIGQRDKKDKLVEMVTQYIKDNIIGNEAVPPPPAGSPPIAASVSDPAPQAASVSTHPPVTVATLPPCPYGSNCYRKNPQHFKEFSHPPDHPSLSQFHS